MTHQSKARRLKTLPNPDTCRDVTALIADYLNGELDSRTTAAIEAHLRQCQDCVAFLNTYRASVEAIRELRYEHLPAELQARALQVLRNRIARKPSRHPGRR